MRRENGRLRERIERLERAAKRQAAPFSRGRRVAGPKRPGRKPGTDYGVRARRPVPDRVDEVVTASLPKRCPDCAEVLSVERVESQFQIELPDPQMLMRRIEVPISTCSGCGRRVQARHPLQTSDALGAASVQFGPRLMAVAALLNKQLGMPHAKVAEALETMFGVRVSRSGLARAIGRVGEHLEPSYDAICDAVARSPVVVPDETGWRVAGEGAWLWAFATPSLTAYQVAQGRGFEAAAALLGEDYAGVIVRDGWVVYRGFAKATHQSCVAHLLRRCSGMLEDARGRARSIPLRVREVLLDALALRAQRDLGVVAARSLRRRITKLTTRIDMLVATPTANRANARLLAHLGTERDALLTFLRLDGVDATNWRAEQAIRPAVVARKVWGGNRTWNGAHAYEVIATVLRTARQQGIDAVDMLIDTLRSTDWDIASALKPVLEYG